MTCPSICACDEHMAQKAREHIEADKRCKRQWSCTCGACKWARTSDSVHAAFIRVEQAELNLQRHRELAAALDAE